MKRPRVFVSREIPECGLSRIQEKCDAEIWDGSMPPPAGDLLEKTRECQGLVSLLTDEIHSDFMDACPELKVISNFAVGFNNIDVAAATARGIRVGHTPGVLTDATADMAFCLMISAARRVVEGHEACRSGEWKTWEPLGFIGQDLRGKTLGIVGMGRIGQEMASRCRRGWDMEILYSDVRQNTQADDDLNARRVPWDELLECSDFISVHADLNDSTHGMFDAAAFRRMKSTAVLVNTARGPIVVTGDLREALESGEIFAAGLDVTDPEPLDSNDPLLATGRVVIAPHVASATVDSRNGMAEICADNLIRGLEGAPLRCCVNPEVESKGDE